MFLFGFINDNALLPILTCSLSVSVVSVGVCEGRGEVETCRTKSMASNSVVDDDQNTRDLVIIGYFDSLIHKFKKKR